MSSTTGQPRNRRYIHILYNRQLAFIPAFSEPKSHWPRAPPLLVLGQSGGEAGAAGVSPRGNPTISPHTGRVGPHSRFSNPTIHLQHRQREHENGDPPGRNRPARCRNPSPINRSLIGWGLYIEPAHPGEDKFLSLGQKSFHISTCLLYTSPSPRDRG